MESENDQNNSKDWIIVTAAVDDCIKMKTYPRKYRKEERKLLEIVPRASFQFPSGSTSPSSSNKRCLSLSWSSLFLLVWKEERKKGKKEKRKKEITKRRKRCSVEGVFKFKCELVNKKIKKNNRKRDLSSWHILKECVKEFELFCLPQLSHLEENNNQIDQSKIPVRSLI